jgi:hypothetical protein
MPIQVDMFEVNLGAALLLQFFGHTGMVRVLADGGVTGYPKEHVRDKLLTSLGGASPIVIDLMVGTHYDADHLDGLVPIVDDQRFAIREAWLPPVLDDQTGNPSGALQTLVGRLVDDQTYLLKYLKNRYDRCVALQRLEAQLLRREYEERAPILEQEEQLARYFHRQLESAEASTETRSVSVLIAGFHEHEHADDEVVHPMEEIEESDLEAAAALGRYLFDDLRHTWPFVLPFYPSRIARNLAAIRQSVAKGAITASSLAKVVAALKKRRIPIRCETIDAGMPKHFGWDDKTKRFMRGIGGHHVNLTLLGPSSALVEKHKSLLPIGTYLGLAAFVDVKIKGLSESNELSYVMKFSAEDQNILVTGDTGFVDFRDPATRRYYPALLRELSPLDVVQVAHHAGRNAHFYNCLLHSAFPMQSMPAHLLLSHRINDRYRPSQQFSQFLRQLPPHNLALFTSQPLKQNVQNIQQYCAPVVGPAVADRGDIRLQYHSGKWHTVQHAIKA